MRGGAREGAGRKAGAATRKTREIANKAAETGELPHEFLLRIARGETIGDHTPTFAEQVDAAKAAAPYYAPKLASVDQTIAGTVGYVAVPVAERDAMDAATRAASGRDPKALG